VLRRGGPVLARQRVSLPTVGTARAVTGRRDRLPGCAPSPEPAAYPVRPGRWPGRPPPATPGASSDIVPRWSVMPFPDRRFVHFSSSASGRDRSPSGSPARLSRSRIGHRVETRHRRRPTGQGPAVAAVVRPLDEVSMSRASGRPWPFRTAGARWAGRLGSSPRWEWPAIRPVRALCPGRCRGTAACPGRRPPGR
jgi:hypothetical protein